jgi:membrane protease YdiL (CAAX protease family)
VAKQLPENPELEPLTRTQVLVAMGVTAVLLLVAAKLWLHLGSVTLLPLRGTPEALLLGLGIAVAITVASSLVYRLWPAYRQSADFYLQLVLTPLVLPDLIWLGLLPGMSEELLFRGVMLPAVGLNAYGPCCLKFTIWYFAPERSTTMALCGLGNSCGIALRV